MVVSENELNNIVVIARSKATKQSQGSARAQLLETFKQMLLNNEDLSAEAIASKFSPEPDLIIIEGEKSLQNSAIVEASYAEIYFCDTYNENEKQKAIEDFKQRKRNFGV